MVAGFNELRGVSPQHQNTYLPFYQALKLILLLTCFPIPIVRETIHWQIYSTHMVSFHTIVVANVVHFRFNGVLSYFMAI